MIEFQNKEYKVESDRLGHFTLSIEDRSVYLQGDDATTFEDALVNLYGSSMEKSEIEEWIIREIEEYTDVMVEREKTMPLEFKNGIYAIQSDKWGNLILTKGEKAVYLSGEDALAFRKTLESRSTKMFIEAIMDYSDVMRDWT